MNSKHGGLAQLGERLAGSQEVRGSNPLSSTTRQETGNGEDKPAAGHFMSEGGQPQRNLEPGHAKGCTRPVNPPPSWGHFQSTIRAQRAQPEHNGPGTAGRFAARSGGLGRPTGRGAGCYRGDGEGNGERAIGDAKMECRTGAGLMAVRLAWASSFPPSIWQAHRVSATSVGAN